MTQSAAEIEREIERTRAQVALTAEALKQKLSPAHMAQSVIRSPPARAARTVARRVLPFAVAAVAVGLLLRLASARAGPAPTAQRARSPQRPQHQRQHRQAPGRPPKPQQQQQQSTRRRAAPYMATWDV